MQLSKRGVQALRILAAYPGGIMAGNFAREMWPGRSGQTYNHSLNQTAGSYLPPRQRAPGFIREVNGAHC